MSDLVGLIYYLWIWVGCCSSWSSWCWLAQCVRHPVFKQLFRDNNDLTEFLRARRDYNFLKPHGREQMRYWCAMELVYPNFVRTTDNTIKVNTITDDVVMMMITTTTTTMMMMIRRRRKATTTTRRWRNWQQQQQRLRLRWSRWQ